MIYRIQAKINLIRKILVVLSFLVAYSCQSNESRNPLLLDFESESDLDRLNWQCHTMFRLSDLYATHGSKSLQIEFYPSVNPKVEPIIYENSWEKYHSICFDIFNPELDSVSLIVVITDRDDFPGNDEMYMQKISVKPGLQHIVIPLDTLYTSGSNRRIDIRKICRFSIMMLLPQRKYVFYIDYLRLV